MVPRRGQQDVSRSEGQGYDDAPARRFCEQGIANASIVLTPYNPAEFAYVNMAIEMSMLMALQGDRDGRGGLAFAGALTDYVLNHCPGCLENFRRQNQVFTGAASSSTYMLLCTKPITSLAALKGARLRAGGAAWSRWARKMGATPVTMAIGETFEGMNQGVVDCSISNAGDLKTFLLMEATKDMSLDVPGGYFPLAGSNINRDTWRKLSDEQRRALLHAGAVMAAELTYDYYELSKQYIQETLDRGATMHQVDPDLVEASHRAIEADMPILGETYQKQHKVAEPEALIEAMRELLAKWGRLVEPVQSSDDLAELLWTEVLSKLDPATYGMQ